MQLNGHVKDLCDLYHLNGIFSVFLYNVIPSAPEMKLTTCSLKHGPRTLFGGKKGVSVKKGDFPWHSDNIFLLTPFSSTGRVFSSPTTFCALLFCARSQFSDDTSNISEVKWCRVNTCQILT